MPRPKKRRHIWFKPDAVYFKPRGVSLADLEQVHLTFEEVEALRLSDAEGMQQKQAAEQMNVSQSTFHRVLTGARQKVAHALVLGKAIEMKGGEFIMPGKDGTGPVGGGGGFGSGGGGRGGGMGRGGGRGFGGPKICKCPECGHEIAHSRGTPCVQMKCPKCQTRMVRGDLA